MGLDESIGRQKFCMIEGCYGHPMRSLVLCNGHSDVWRGYLGHPGDSLVDAWKNFLASAGEMLKGQQPSLWAEWV